VLLSVVGATAAQANTSWTTMSTGSTLTFKTSVLNAAATLTTSTTSTRYTQITNQRLHRADYLQHKLSHRSLDYECLKCDRGFKTYGGMVTFSLPNNSGPSLRLSDHPSRIGLLQLH
jgi:hypothetical protein